MKLDRNIQSNQGRGKYALLKLRELPNFEDQQAFGGLSKPIADALAILTTNGLIEWGEPESENEFFVLKLKDFYARSALVAYQNAARDDGEIEFANEVAELAGRSGVESRWCKRPD